MALPSQPDDGVLQPSALPSAGRDRLRTSLFVANGVVNALGIPAWFWFREHGPWDYLGLQRMFLSACVWAIPELILLVIALGVTARRKGRGERPLGLVRDWGIAMGAGWAISWAIIYLITAAEYARMGG